MGAARPRRWKLPFHRTGGSASAPSSPSAKSSAAPPCSPARSAAWAEDRAPEEEAAPPEFVCPISGVLMADPVILPSGRTYERACLRACAELAFLPPGVEPGGADTIIPNTALKAAIGTWCARTGRELPARPSAEAAREAVLRVMRPPEAAAAPKSVRTSRRPAAVAVASSSNSSYSSPASTSSYGSSSEITPAEDDGGRSVKVTTKAAAAAQKETTAVQAEPALPVDPLEDEVVAKVMGADDDEDVMAAAVSALREATRESAERRRALCTPRLLGALRRVLLLPRHACARVDAAAALVNLSLEPANKVRIVRAGAVPALVDVLRSGTEEAREHAAGALFGLALDEGNRAAIGVLGAVPPLLDLLASAAAHHPARARRDAGMALYHLSLAAVNQSKIARLPGAPKALLAVAASAAEPPPIRRLALMVTCNVSACAEGRAALMDAGAVASVSGILRDPPSSSHDAAAASSSSSKDLEEWCVAALYAMSRGSLRFRGLARAAGADKALRRVAEEGGGVRREMAKKTLRAMRGDLDEDENDLTGSSLECGDGEDCGGSIVSDGLMSFRRRQRELGVSSCGNTAEF